MSGGQFLFAYGSLIDPESRGLSGEVGIALPGLLRGYRQGWNQPYGEPSKTSNTTYLGVVPESGAASVGVFIELSREVLEHTLQGLDLREKNGEVYNRVQVEPGSIKLLTGSCSIESAWVYEVMNPGKPSDDFPIWQSYVDVVLRGCLSFGEPFAERFVRACENWSGPWIDDRRRPRYSRAGSLIGLQERERIDAILSDCTVLHYRSPE